MAIPRPRKKYGNPEIDELLSHAIATVGSDDNDDLVRSLMVTALDMDEADIDRLDLKIASQSLAEIFNTWKIFSPYNDKPKITVFGSARTNPDHPDYKLTVDFGNIMAQRSWMAITGAGPGIMKAGIEGIGVDNAFGVNIVLPFEQKATDIIEGNDKLATFRYFFTRKLAFMKESDAFALFPGGFGTLDELFELLTLIHTGKSYPAPIVLVDNPDSTYWTGWQKFVHEELVTGGFVNESSVDTYLHTHDPVEAANYISAFYSCYHSLRYVKGRLVLRLTSPLEDSALETLNSEFQDIIVSGAIERTETTKAEIRDGDHPDLSRIAFKFNDKSFDRLLLMIDRVNELAGEIVEEAPVNFVHDVSPEPDED